LEKKGETSWRVYRDELTLKQGKGKKKGEGGCPEALEPGG